MSSAATAEMVPLNEPGKSTSLACSDDVHSFIRRKDIDHHLVARIGSLIACHCHLADKTGGRNIRFFEVAGHGLVHAAGLQEFHEPELDSVIAVFLLRLFLNHYAGARLDHCDGHDSSVVLQQLRHAEFLSK